MREESEKWVPESLKVFMKLVIPSKLKQLSLGECIVQAENVDHDITTLTGKGTFNGMGIICPKKTLFTRMTASIVIAMY